MSLALEGAAPLEVVLVTAAGSRPTRRAAAVAALSTEVLRRRGARIGTGFTWVDARTATRQAT